MDEPLGLFLFFFFPHCCYFEGLAKGRDLSNEKKLRWDVLVVRRPLVPLLKSAVACEDI